MTPPSRDGDLYAPPAASVVDREPPTWISKASRVCLYSAAGVSAGALALTFGPDGLVPDNAIAPLMAVGSCVVPTAWLLRLRARMADGADRPSRKRIALLSLALSACTLALATALTLVGVLCVYLLPAFDVPS